MNAHERVQLIHHADRPVVLVDLSNVQERQDVEGCLEQYVALVKSQPPGQGLTLTDLTNAHYDRELGNRWRDAGNALDPHVRKAALVGLDGIMRMVVSSAIAIAELRGSGARGKTRTFGTRAEALDWLVAP